MTWADQHMYNGVQLFSSDSNLPDAINELKNLNWLYLEKNNLTKMPNRPNTNQVGDLLISLIKKFTNSTCSNSWRFR